MINYKKKISSHTLLNVTIVVGSDEWRLKLIVCVSEAKEAKLDYRNMWRYDIGNK